MFFYFEPTGVFQILVKWLFWRNEIRFWAAILKRNIFWMFFLLIYGYFRCIHDMCKFRTEIPTGKNLKMVGSKWTPLMHKREWKVA